MPKLLAISAKKTIKALETPGSRVYRQTGSQIHFWNDVKKLVVTVPKHPEMAKGTLISIMKQAGLRERNPLRP